MRENTKENGNSDRAEGSSRQISKQSWRNKGKLAAGDQFGGDFLLTRTLVRVLFQFNERIKYSVIVRKKARKKVKK